MECTDKAQSCVQSCTKDCKMICKTKDPTKCQQMPCQQGGCTYEGPPANKTSCDPLASDKDTCVQTGCLYKDCRMACLKPTISQKACFQACAPNKQLCPLSMTCDTENCTQLCVGKCEKAECGASTSCIQQCGGSCKSTRCTSKMCSQTCTDGACEMECADGTDLCHQISNSTSSKSLVSKASKAEIQFCLQDCDRMECKSENCTQKCRGNCPKMVCNGNLCDQTCEGESCEMRCPESVKSCTQTCTKGTCKYSCQADVCKLNCKDSKKCTKVPENDAASFSLNLALAVNALFFVIINLIH